MAAIMLQSIPKIVLSRAGNCIVILLAYDTGFEISGGLLLVMVICVALSFFCSSVAGGWFQFAKAA